MTAAGAALVLLTACTSGDDDGDAPGASAAIRPPGATASAEPAGTPNGGSPDDTPTSGPSAGRTGAPPAVPPADAEPCPATYDTAASQPWVPAPPRTETAGRLAPDADPVEVVLCRYAPVTTGPAALDGAPVRIGSELLQVRTDLQVPPRTGDSRACTPEGPRVPYLARLTYADGDLWVASADTANGCADTGNGVFVSGSSRGEQLAASYDAGAWVPAVGS